MNLALNAGWNWLFWRVRKPWPATVEAAALTISSADPGGPCRTARSHRGAGAALVPYAAWVCLRDRADGRDRPAQLTSEQLLGPDPIAGHAVLSRGDS